ncbi:CLUMA_CG019225, isoform A [Clunio marinus]|uniref:CLUMA_CG019225, isoform A n=1 Tax=Clunio marinus TaxID=568069 RepID=A0A1J1J2E9_9DIPT|nr:CLUMA_CG019225, isoform A [Clunio marinus]
MLLNQTNKPKTTTGVRKNKKSNYCCFILAGVIIISLTVYFLPICGGFIRFRQKRNFTLSPKLNNNKKQRKDDKQAKADKFFLSYLNGND